MSDYIKREDVLACTVELMHPFLKDMVAYRFIDPYEVEKLPSADVRENVRGEWIKQSIFWTCSECEKDIRVTTDGIDNFDEDPVFCPYCGADMRGDKHGGKNGTMFNMRATSD